MAIGDIMFTHRVLLALCFICGATFVFDQDLQAEAPQLSFEELRDQGMLYFRKKRYKQAYRALTEAVKMPKGTEDYKANYTLARTAAKMLLLEEAFLKANESLKLAGDNEKRKNAVSGFIAELESRYGGVQIVPAPGETNRKGRIFLEAKTGILNKKKKEVFQTIRKRFRETEIQLPHGNFLANNVPVKVTPEQITEVALYLQVDRVIVEDGGINWWWIGGGVAATITTGVVTFVTLQEDVVTDNLKAKVRQPDDVTTE